MSQAGTLTEDDIDDILSQEKPSSDPFAYLEYEKKLIDVMQAIGMSSELNNHLCEYCFNRLNQVNSKQSEQEQSGLKLTKTIKQKILK